MLLNEVWGRLQMRRRGVFNIETPACLIIFGAGGLQLRHSLHSETPGRLAFGTNPLGRFETPRCLEIGLYFFSVQCLLNMTNKVIILIHIIQYCQFSRTNKCHKGKRGRPSFDFGPFKAQLVQKGRPKHDFVYFGANLFQPKAFYIGFGCFFFP